MSLGSPIFLFAEFNNFMAQDCCKLIFLQDPEDQKSLVRLPCFKDSGRISVNNFVELVPCAEIRMDHLQ